MRATWCRDAGDEVPNVARGTLHAIAMTSNPDDSVVFGSGDRRVLVVPVTGS